MGEQDIHLTKRHFFRRILSQKVERLEGRETDFEAESERLERVLAQTSEPEPETYTGLKDTVARTEAKIAAIVDLSRAEAELTLKRMGHEEAKLLALLEKIRLEYRRPTQGMGEIATQIHDLSERAQSSADFLVKQAQQEQTRLSGELQALYGERVDWETTIAKVRQKLHNLQDEAVESASLLVAQARREREWLLNRTGDLHQRLLQLPAAGRAATGVQETGEVADRTEGRPAPSPPVSRTANGAQLARTARDEREKLLSSIAAHKVDAPAASLPITKEIPLRKTWVVTSLLLAGLGIAALLGTANQAPQAQYIFLILLTFVTVAAFASGNAAMTINVLALSLAIYALFHLEIDVPATFIDISLHTLLLLLAALASWKISQYLRRVQGTVSQQDALIKQLASLDPETGAIQMNYLQLRLAEEVARTSRYQDPLTVMAVKPAGTGEVTKEMTTRLSRLLDSTLRRADNMGIGEDGRWMLVLPETDLYSAEEVANRLMKLTHDQFGLVLRIGIAAFPEDGVDSSELLDRAQDALEMALRDDIPIVSRALARR